MTAHRVRKDHARVEAYGTVDEANSAIGMILACPDCRPTCARCLTEIQHDLFDLGGELCIPGTSVIKAEQIVRLEEALDAFNDPLPALKDFILPGGGPAASACHLARTIVRRAERRVWTLAAAEAVNPEVPKYLNRLSDLLFVIARVLARHENRLRGALAARPGTFLIKGTDLFSPYGLEDRDALSAKIDLSPFIRNAAPALSGPGSSRTTDPDRSCARARHRYGRRCAPA